MSKSNTSNSRDYFFCYNKHISNFIKSKGVKHITVAQDPITQKIFTLFEITPQFQLAMDEYKTQTKSKR